MAIIKKFNKALDNISGDVSRSDCGPAHIAGMSINEGDEKILDKDATTNLLEKASEN